MRILSRKRARPFIEWSSTTGAGVGVGVGVGVGDVAYHNTTKRQFTA